PPRLVVTLLIGRIEIRETYGETERTVRELVDVRNAVASAAIIAVRVEIAVRVLVEAAVDRQLPRRGLERPDRLHVQRAREALPHERRIRRLVHGRGVDELGRELVELHRAVVAGAHHLAAV